MTTYKRGDKLTAEMLQEIADAAGASFTATGASAVTRAIGDKLRERVTPEDFGAKGDGATDDSAAIQAALSAAPVVELTRGKIYIAKDLVVNGRTLLGRGAILRAAPGARWIVQVRGSHAKVRDLQLEDPNNYLVRQTTLAAGAASGSSSITVADAAGIEARMAVAIELDNGEWHNTVIASVAGAVLTLDRATTAAAAAGKRVWAMHAALWLADGAIYFDVQDILIKGIWGGLVAKSSTASASGASFGTVRGIKSYGARFFGYAVHGNSYDIEWDDLVLRSGTNLVSTHTGDGATTTFAFQEQVVRIGDTSDLTVRVNGAALAEGVGYTITGPSQVTLATPPAVGASVSITNNYAGLFGLWCDQTGKTTTSGGHLFGNLKLLGPRVGVHLVNAELLNFNPGVVDTIPVDGIRLEGTIRTVSFLGFRSLFCGASCIRAIGSDVADARFTALRTSTWPASSRYGGVAATAIVLDAGSSIIVDETTWAAGGRSVAGAGRKQTLADAVSFTTPGGEQVRILDVGTAGSAVNYVELSGNNAGSNPGVKARGADTNVGLQVAAKGNGVIFVIAPGTGAVNVQTGAAPTTRLTVDTNRVDVTLPLRLASYTVATLPSASTHARSLIYVSDGASNKRLAISDGTNWRWPDGAVVS